MTAIWFLLRFDNGTKPDQLVCRDHEEKDIGGSLGSRLRVTSLVTRYAGQVLEPEKTVRLG
jgi:hypothetical protein